MRKNEKPYYYSTTIENGEIVEHEGDKNHAVYLSEMRIESNRANRWHKWVEKNVPNAYSTLGIVDINIYNKYREIREAFMTGKRIK